MGKAKKYACACALVLAVLASAAMSAEEWMTAKHFAVLDYLKAEDAATVKDAIWTLPDMLKIGVLANGQSRDGFARYVCEVVREQGVRGASVQIVDIVKLQRNRDWTPIGNASCK